MSHQKPSKPISVCFVSPKAYPLFDPAADGVIGGAEVDLYLLATELAKDNHYNVTCITADYKQPDLQIIENVKIIKSLNFKQNQITGAIKIWKAIKKAKANIYKMKTPSPGVPLVAAFCKLHKRCFVYRGASEREFNGVYLEKHPVLGRLFLRSLRRAAVITVQNHSDAELLQSAMNIDATVIPNGHRRADLDELEKQTILWVGRSVDVKKPYRFLELAEKFPDEQFIMICQPATGDNDYETLVTRAREIPNIQFHKSVPFKEIENYFAKAKVLVNTSDSEGFPNTFIQAAKAQTAILSYTVNPDNFLDKYKCGTDANADTNQLSKALNQILKNNQYKEMGKKAKQYFLKKHDVKKIIQLYKDIFGRLV